MEQTMDDMTAPQKWSQSVLMVTGCSIGLKPQLHHVTEWNNSQIKESKYTFVILGSSHHTIICTFFWQAYLFDAMKTGWKVMIHNWGWLVLGLSRAWLQI